MHRPPVFSRAIATFLIVAILSPSVAFAQSGGNGGSQSGGSQSEGSESRVGEDASDTEVLAEGVRAVLALTSPDYRVSPGDQYRLSWVQGGSREDTELVVESDRRVSAGLFGEIDAAGMTFSEFRTELQDRVTAQYPNSYPQVIIRSLGRYEVPVRGAATSTDRVTIDGLTRLSRVFSRRAADYASERRVTVIDEDGPRDTYDLYAARREEDLSQNPYVRPDQTVRFHEAERVVRLSGAVRRGGRYELLEGEELEQLIERYGEGFAREADRSRVQIDRLVDGEIDPAERRDLDLRSTDAADVTLKDGDEVRVFNRNQIQPTVFLEGAVGAEPATEEGGESRGDRGQPSASSRRSEAFTPGDTVSDLMRRISDELPEAADLENAYMVRGGDRREVNLAEQLYEPRRAERIELRGGDRLVVPFDQVFVTVRGGVKNPGVYPYIPDRGYEYYLDLAGGVDPEQRIGRTPRVRDSEGEPKSPAKPIEPEDTIVFRRNNPLATIAPWVTFISSVVSLATTFYSIFGN